jgi:hypothetical protein
MIGQVIFSTGEMVIIALVLINIYLVVKGK